MFKPRLKFIVPLILIFSLVVGVLLAQAHNPSVTHTCDSLSISLTSYAGTGNHVTATIGGTTVVNTDFNASYSHTFNIPAHYPSTHVFVQVTAQDDPNNAKGFSPTFNFDVVPCNPATATPTHVPPTLTPTHLPPTHTPTHAPPTHTPEHSPTPSNTPVHSPTPSNTPVSSPTPTNTTDPRTSPTVPPPPPGPGPTPVNSNANCVGWTSSPNGIFSMTWDDGTPVDGYAEVKDTQVSLWFHFPGDQPAPTGTVHFNDVTITVDWSRNPVCQETVIEPTATLPSNCPTCQPHKDENLAQDSSGALSMQVTLQENDGTWHRLIVSSQPFGVLCPASTETMIDDPAQSGYFIAWVDEDCMPSRRMLLYEPCAITPDPTNLYWWDAKTNSILLLPGQASSEISAALVALGKDGNAAYGKFTTEGWYKLS